MQLAARFRSAYRSAVRPSSSTQSDRFGYFSATTVAIGRPTLNV